MLSVPYPYTNGDVEYFYSFRPAGNREVYWYTCASRQRVYGVIGLYLGNYPNYQVEVEGAGRRGRWSAVFERGGWSVAFAQQGGCCGCGNVRSEI